MYRYSEDISKGFLAIPPSIHRPCSKISRDLQAWILSRDELVVRLNTNGFICKEKNRERKRRGREEGQTASQISLLFSLPRLLSPSSFFRNQNPTLKHSTLLDKRFKRYRKFNRWCLHCEIVGVELFRFNFLNRSFVSVVSPSWS